MPATLEGIKALCTTWKLDWKWPIGTDIATKEIMERDCDCAPDDNWLIATYQAFRQQWYQTKEKPGWQDFLRFMWDRRRSYRTGVMPKEKCFFCRGSGIMSAVVPMLDGKPLLTGYEPGEPYAGRGRLYSYPLPCACVQGRWDSPLAGVRSKWEVLIVKANEGEWPMTKAKVSPGSLDSMYMQLCDATQLSGNSGQLPVPETGPIVTKTGADDDVPF